jgi:CRISPR-associated protein Csb2
MPVLALHFPWSRYHATPWGRHVNEGAVEVPPSPWRVLRALYSVWKLRAPDLDEETVHGLLAQLAAPPTYVLPPYRISHTRHYLPDSKHRNGTISNDLALDAFAILGGDATIYAKWPGELTAEQDKALDRLAASLPYLGRADSLCDARVERGWRATGGQTAVPLDLDDAPPGLLRTELLSPTLPLDLEALVKRPVEVRAGKLVFPPGSRFVTYAVPPPEHPKPQRRRARPASVPVTAVRLSLTGLPQPRAVDTVKVTDALRSACVKALTQLRGGTPAASILAGKDADGQPLQGHRHAHFLALNDKGQINELAIWAPGGLSPEEMEALNLLVGRTIGVPKDVRGPRDLHVRVTAYGEARELLPDSITTPAKTWVSSTAFVPSRYRARGQAPDDYLFAEITRELSYRNIPKPASVTVVPGGEWGLYTRHRWSQQRRSNEAASTKTTARPALGIRINFTEPQGGPLTLGTLAHFGLGLLQAAQ